MFSLKPHQPKLKHLPLMFDILIDAFQIEIFLVAVESVDALHPEGMLNDFLRSQEKYVLVLVREVQGLRQDAEKFRVLEGDTQPFIDDKLIQESVQLKLRHGWCLSLK